MKTKKLWVAIALVFAIQGITAQKVENIQVPIESYKKFETILMEALSKYRIDYLKNGISATIAEQELVVSAQTAIFEAFMADKEKVVDALLSKPVTVTVNIGLSYEISKDFPMLQSAYVKEMTAFWNGFASRGIKESLGYTPRHGERESNISRTTTTVTEEINGQTKSIVSSTKETVATNDLVQVPQTEPRSVNFKVPQDLEPYINPLLTEVKMYVHQWVNTWLIKQ